MKSTTVVIGSGIAGLGIAKMLSNPRRRIVVVGRQLGPSPQSRHLHVLLASGQRLLAEHFPNVLEEIKATCPLINWGSDTYWRTPVGPLPNTELSTATYLLSRRYLDELLLSDLRRTEGVDFMEDVVTDFGFTRFRDRIERVITKTGEIACHYCIDASGRSAVAQKILEAQSKAVVPVDTLRTTLKYYSTIATQTKEGRFRQAYYQIDPQRELYGGVISPIEHGRLVATFITLDQTYHLNGQNPFHLIEDETFREFAANLEFEGVFQPFGQLHNILRHYEAFPGLPSNLFLIGDSVCQFNPVFGQGMTVALRSAQLLSTYFEKGRRHAQTFQEKLLRTLWVPWALSTMDAYNPHVGSNWSRRFTRGMLHRTIRRCSDNTRTHQCLLDVLHMERSPLSLLRPRHLL